MSQMAGGPAGGAGDGDFQLTPEDRPQLLYLLGGFYNSEERAAGLLRLIRFPMGLVPPWPAHGGTSVDFWSSVFEELDRGVMRMPYRSLIAAVRATYSTNDPLANLQARYTSPAPAVQGDQAAPQAEPQAPAPAPEEQPTRPDPAETCHLVVWLNSPEARTKLETWLIDHGLEPQMEWTTPSSLSYRVNQTDPGAVDRLMLTRQDIPWTVVAPGARDYVLRYLHVEGPDGRNFRFNDVPSATPVSDVAGQLVDQYTGGLPGGDQPTVVDRVDPDGSHRMNPDSTLGDEGVTEGARLRVGFERRAAAPNPLDRREALFRVRNQIMEYRDTHPGFQYTPNSPAVPTEYDIEFTQQGFGPPRIPGDDPADIDFHQLAIVLPPDFPIVAPRVRWLTEVYHPNVYPTYESELLRERPYARGLVCLGTLAESFQPSLDFGELCATLTDIAGYRNYSVFVPAKGPVDAATGEQGLRGDYYDKEAAYWAVSARGQERIRKIGGVPVFRAMTGRRPSAFGFEVDADFEADEADEYGALS